MRVFGNFDFEAKYNNVGLPLPLCSGITPGRLGNPCGSPGIKLGSESARKVPYPLSITLTPCLELYSLGNSKTQRLPLIILPYMLEKFNLLFFLLLSKTWGFKTSKIFIYQYSKASDNCKSHSNKMSNCKKWFEVSSNILEHF